MNRLHAVCVTLTVLGLVAGCKDPVSQNDRGASPSIASGVNQSASRSLSDRGPKRQIAVLDECDPNDPAWAPTGGCSLKGGTVTNAQFGALLASPLSLSVIGHPGWRNEPSYVAIGEGESVRVSNEGGRTHTFTEVANFGGGRVPPLRMGLTPAPECLAAPTTADLLPGAGLELHGLAVGVHRFQCCIHSWMRASITVTSDKKGN
jgi:plastocyanin